MSNKAAWITATKATPLEVKEAPMPKPEPNQVVVKNHAVAINPVDWKIQDYGIIIKQYPNVLGADVAGEVHEVGEAVQHLKKGDRVLGHSLNLLDQDPAKGAFQYYTLFAALTVQKIPSSISYAEATVLPLAISTAAQCLFHKEALGLPLPTSANSPVTGKSVLVWGGSSSVGATAIQLAVGAGVKVVSVASAHNLDKVKELGAFAVFDYKSPSVTHDIVSALAGTEFAGVCDAIGAAGAWAPIYQKLGGKYGTVSQGGENVPEGIQGFSSYAATIAVKDLYIGEAIWGKWVPWALEHGKLKSRPDPVVVGKGLESLQEAMDVQRKGVSFSKIVVEL